MNYLGSHHRLCCCFTSRLSARKKDYFELLSDRNIVVKELY